MGLLGRKQKPAETPEEQAALVFDDAYREELRTRGRDYFQRIIDDSSSLFQQDLDASLASVNTELRQHTMRRLDTTLGDMHTQLTRQIDEQFVEFDNSMKRAQEKAIASLEEKASQLEDKTQQLNDQLTKNLNSQNESFTRTVADQEAKLQESLTKQNDLLEKAYGANQEKIVAASQVQAVSMQALSTSVKALQQQHDDLGKMIESNVANQEAMIIELFENNLAQVVEHYLLKALGDQFDVKSQLPAILAQLKADKQDMMDDMRL